MERRRFVQLSLGAAFSTATGMWLPAVRGEDARPTAEISETAASPPVFSVTPVDVATCRRRRYLMWGVCFGGLTWRTTQRV